MQRDSNPQPLSLFTKSSERGRLRDLVAGRPGDQVMGRPGDVPGTSVELFFKIQLTNTLNLL